MSAPTIRQVDSYSDGMFGWVKLTDGKRTVRVTWSVTAKIDTPGLAYEVAERQLREGGS